MRILVLSFLLFISICPAFSDDAICTDLYQEMTTPGVVDDGTGRAVNPSNISEVPDRIRDAINQDARNRFLELLRNPASDLNRQILPASASVFRECAGAPENVSDACMNIIAASIAGQVLSDSNQPYIDCEEYTSTQEYRAAADEISQDIRREIGTETVRARYERTFEEIKEVFYRKIPELVRNPAAQAAMIAKVRNLQLNIACGNRSERLNVDAHLTPGANYYGSVNICPAMSFYNDSEFMLATTLAHEIGHAIDPCSIELGNNGENVRYTGATVAQREAEYPVQGLIRCLRSPQSYGAIRDQTSSDFCSRDQIPEATAEFFASQVVPEHISSRFPQLTQEQYRKGYSNIFRGLPPARNEASGSPYHLNSRQRVNSIMLVSPAIRRQMGCPATLPGKRSCAP